MSRWTEEDLKKLRPGMVSLPATGEPKAPAATKAPVRKEAPELLEMKAWLRILKVDFIPEHRFHPKRKWRFDIAIPAQMLGIEYEGIFSDKSGHTTLSGYKKDTEKYNAATLLGWKLLRYTSDNYQDFMKHITDLLNIKEV